MQLTIRLIRIFSIPTTLMAALVQTPVFLICCAGFMMLLGSRADLLIIPALAMGLTGYAVARWVLRVRRTRGQIVAGIGTAILASPWPVFILLIPR
jgi:uncharacterized membrane protein